RATKGAEQIEEQQKKIESLHERHEKFLADNQRIHEARFESLQAELKAKSATISDLQESARKAALDSSARSASQAETDLKIARLQMELELSQGQAKHLKEVERELAVLTVQLQEEKRRHESSLSSAEKTVEERLVPLQNELAASKAELAQT